MGRLLIQELKFRIGAMIGWSLGLCFFPLVYIAIYPSVAEQMAGLADLEIYKAMGINLGTFPDWLGSIMLVIFPLVTSIFAIINGTGTLAGEEEDGRLEMIVTLPHPRWKIITAKALALSISLFVITLVVSSVSWLVFILLEGQIDTTMTGMQLFRSVLSTWPMVFAVGMLSIFLAVFCSNRRTASTIAAAILVIGYFGSNLSASTKVLEPFEPLFLFTYVDGTGRAVIEGQAAGDLSVLLGIGLVSFALALFFFQKRRLTVAAWPWQRGRVEG